MIRGRAKTQYAVTVEKEVYHVAEWTIKKAAEAAMYEYYEAFGHPTQLDTPINYLVTVMHVGTNKTYTFNVAAAMRMVYEVKKEG